jgi:TonB-dependent SusC/RagA subfamily outer membrane receptor
MNQVVIRTLFTLALTGGSVGTLLAQRAMTVAGHVTSQGAPLTGAHVRVDELRIDRTTDSDGRYSFVIPSSSVLGQKVTIIATMGDRRVRYVPVSATITLVGAPLTQDFDLVLATGSNPVVIAADSGLPAAITPEGVGPTVVAVRGGLDIDDAAGVGTVSSVLIGRIAGLRVSPSASPGGSSQLVFRGPRSVLGSNQPLFVVDGMPMSNTVFTSAAQRFGFGGFDYGSSVDDIDLASVESIQFLSAADATTAYGGRGANGVVLVTTKSGVGGPHFAVGASHVMTGGSSLRLPSFQNSYGQGLDGQFSFFDGRGGGTNDGVDQNWGPALDGRPLAQFGYIDAGHADVRLWVPNPNNVSTYFVDGGTSHTTATIQARGDAASFSAVLGDRGVDGITPRDHVGRRDAAFHLSVHPTPRFDLSLSALGAETKNENSPGTGAAEANPVFEFLRMGRQVETNILEKRLVDAAGQQISWNYAGHNNPFFESQVGSNYSRRYHTAGAASVAYSLTSSLTATARGGVDNERDGRLFTVPTGWMGGFPFFSGAGDFSRGGSEGDEISVKQNSAGFRLDNKATLAGGTRWTLGAGVDLQTNEQTIRSAGVDSAANVPSAGAPATATVPQPVMWSATSSTKAVFGETGFAFANGASIQGSVRNAWVSLVPDQTASVILPALRASFNFLHDASATLGAVTSAVVRGSWWMDTPESTPYVVETMYAGRPTSGAVAPVGAASLRPGGSLTPEVTNGFEVGTDIGFRKFGLGLGLTYYHEATSDVILPVAGSSGELEATNVGSMTNQGIDARLTAQLGDGEDGFGWRISANASKNSNTVDQLSGSQASLLLGPTRWGLSVEAQPGQPLGVLRGLRLQRNSSGALVLRNGLPVADSSAGAQQLGVGQPSWWFGLANTLRYRWVSISAQADGRLGGQVFSATNMIGTYSGTLASTAFRPDTGLLIAGVDATTGQANTQHVSAQDYYHALGSVPAPWVYSASFVKLREARVSAAIPLGFASLPFERVSASLVGRNLAMWAKAPNIDPEVVFSPYQLQGVEMGQLPTTKSIGIEITIVP